MHIRIEQQLHALLKWLTISSRCTVHGLKCQRQRYSHTYLWSRVALVNTGRICRNLFMGEHARVPQRFFRFVQLIFNHNHAALVCITCHGFDTSTGFNGGAMRAQALSQGLKYDKPPADTHTLRSRRCLRLSDRYKSMLRTHTSG